MEKVIHYYYLNYIEPFLGNFNINVKRYIETVIHYYFLKVNSIFESVYKYFNYIFEIISNDALYIQTTNQTPSELHRIQEINVMDFQFKFIKIEKL